MGGDASPRFRWPDDSHRRQQFSDRSNRGTCGMQRESDSLLAFRRARHRGASAAWNRRLRLLAHAECETFVVVAESTRCHPDYIQHESGAHPGEYCRCESCVILSEAKDLKLYCLSLRSFAVFATQDDTYTNDRSTSAVQAWPRSARICVRIK